MKDNKYTVIFTNHNYEIVFARTKAEAIILAQARMIQAELSHNVEGVKDENDNVI